MEHISLDGVIHSSGEDNFPFSDWTAAYRIRLWAESNELKPRH
jgi:hypothetical protein